jgi:hypothetical protein
MLHPLPPPSLEALGEAPAMAPRKTPTAASVFVRINSLIDSLSPGEQVALWHMLLTRPGWLGDRINGQGRPLELGMQHVVKGVVFPMEKKLKARQQEYDDLVARYTRGAKARAQQKKQRQELLRQYVSAGLTDPRRILDALRQHAPELATVSLKTIQNQLAEL